MRETGSEGSFNGVHVFCATAPAQKATLDTQVTQWLKTARLERPGFRIVDVVVRQSSAFDFHCISLVVFFREDPTPRRAPRAEPRDAPQGSRRS